MTHLKTATMKKVQWGCVWSMCLAAVASTVSPHVPTLCTRVPPILPAGEEPPRDGRLSLVTARTTREETQGCDSASVKVFICSPMDFVLVVVNMTGGRVVLRLGCFAGRERATRVSLGPCWGAWEFLWQIRCLHGSPYPAALYSRPNCHIVLTHLMGPPVGHSCHLETPCCGNFHGREINLKFLLNFELWHE